MEGARKKKKLKDTTTNKNPVRNVSPSAHMYLRSQEKNLNYLNCFVQWWNYNLPVASENLYSNFTQLQDF